MNNEPNYPVKALWKALSILEFLLQNKSPVGISEISKQLSMFPSNIHRMLSTLKHWGYVEQVSDTQKYCLGLKVVELGMAKIHNLDLYKETNPFLQKLAKQFDETTNLGVLEQKEVLYLDKVESTQTVKTVLYPGRRAPVHCTALGKALLAFQLPEVRKKIVGKKLKKYNKNTITNRDILEKELEKIRKSGYALDFGEQVEEVQCVAAPIYNVNREVIAAISISVPAFRMNEKKRNEMIQTILSVTNKISKRMGYKSNK